MRPATTLVTCAGLFVAACGDRPLPDHGGGAAASGGSASTDHADASGTTDGRPSATTTAVATESTVSSDSSSSAGSTSNGASSTGEPVDPTFAACEDPPATIEVERAMSPRGPFVVDEAEIAAWVCSWTPYFVFRQVASEDGAVPSFWFRVVLVDGWNLQFPLVGSYPAALELAGEAMGVIVFHDEVEALGPEDIDPVHPIRARIELDGGGWDFAAEVELFFCGAGECDCPCE